MLPPEKALTKQTRGRTSGRSCVSTPSRGPRVCFRRVCERRVKARCSAMDSETSFSEYQVAS